MLSLNLTAHSIVPLHNELSMTSLIAMVICVRNYKDDQRYSTTLFCCRKAFAEL